jgi:hypothetical protein
MPTPAPRRKIAAVHIPMISQMVDFGGSKREKDNVCMQKRNFMPLVLDLMMSRLLQLISRGVLYSIKLTV